MSRYRLSAQQPGLTVTVGWDHPLCTLFAQVFAPAIEDDEAACLLWIGTALREIPTVAALQAQLAGWATIPPAILDCLTHDQQAATPPTPLQQWVLQRLHGPGAPRPDRAEPRAGGAPRAPLRLQTTTIAHMGGFFYGDPTAYDPL
jgi:hypothetical protein